MAYSTDGGGLAFSCRDIKLSVGASTWATKLSQLYKQKGTVRITTYSLPNLAYVQEQFARRPSGIYLIAHAKFAGRAHEIKRAFPFIRIALHNTLHSKILLVEPRTVYITSANFGHSGWHETGIGLHSREAHDYACDVFQQLWKESAEVH